MAKFKTGQLVNTTKRTTIDDPQIEKFLIKSRKNTVHSTIDSPIHLHFNKLWLVKHNKIKYYRGIPVTFYAVYHESEIDIVEEL